VSIHRTHRSVSILILVFFLVFIFDPPPAEAVPRPRFARVSFTVHARVKLTRRGGRTVPLELHVGHKVFPFVQRKGEWGVVMRASEMARLAPEFPQQLGLQIGAMATTRIRELVHGNRSVAQEIVDSQRQGRGKAFSREESALMNRMTAAYQQVMAQQAFFFPEIQPDAPGQGGWWFVDDQSSGGGGESDDSDHSGGEDEASWFTGLMGLLLVTVLMIAPVAAAIWLAAQAITIATVTAAFLGSIGAVTAASLFVTTMCTIENILTGNVYSCWDNEPVEPHYPPGHHY